MVFVDVTHAKKKTNGSFATARPFARASSSAARPRVHKGGGEEFFGEYGCCVAKSQSERPFGARMD